MTNLVIELGNRRVARRTADAVAVVEHPIHKPAIKAILSAEQLSGSLGVPHNPVNQRSGLSWSCLHRLQVGTHFSLPLYDPAGTAGTHRIRRRRLRPLWTAIR
jgi:hypothetical protein